MIKELITQRVKLFEVEAFASLAEELVKSPTFPGREAEKVELVRKFFTADEDKAPSKGLQEGQVRHTITTAAIDRDGEVMKPKGADLKWYRKNPVVLWSHDYRLPGNIIGKNVSMERADTGIKAVTQFDMLDEGAAKIYRLYKEQYLRAWSVGFVSVQGKRPTEKEVEELVKGGIIILSDAKPGEVRYIHEKWQLLEYSAVAVPANPEALTEAVAKSYKLSPELVKQLGIELEGLEIPSDGDAVLFDLGGIGELEVDDDGEPEEEGAAAAAKAADTEGDEEAEWYDLETFEKNIGIEGTPDDVTDQEWALKPYPNEHACRLKDPEQFDSFRSSTRKHEDKTYRVIFGIKEGKATEQAYRYPKDAWKVAEARSHCKGHDGILFEPAKALLVDQVTALEPPEDWLAWAGQQSSEVKYDDGVTTFAYGGHDFKFTWTGDEYTPWDDGDTTVWPWADDTTGAERPWKTVVYPSPDMSRVLEELAEMKEKLAGLEEAKAGRVLSAKNRELISKAAAACTAAAEALNGLLKATEPAPEEGGEEEEKGLDITGLCEKNDIDLNALLEGIEKTVDIDALGSKILKR